MSMQSRYERKERRGSLWPGSEKSWAKHRKVLRIWATPAYLAGQGKKPLISNGGKP